MDLDLIKAIRERKSAEPFGYGICTADRYVERVLKECPDVAEDGLVEKAASVLTYSDDQMVYDVALDGKASSTRSFKDMLPEGVEAPPNTLMLIRHVLTTNQEDRDGDVLEPSGAELDPKAPLLWQHVQTLPIGKVLGVVEKSKSMLKVVSAIVDINELTSDAAKLFENDVLRFSHGFQVSEFDERKGGGFHITKYNIFEASAVSVPANTGAVPEAIATQKFESDVAKKFVKSLMPEPKAQVRGVDFDGGNVVMNNCEVKSLTVGDSIAVPVDETPEETVEPKAEPCEDKQEDVETKRGRQLSAKNRKTLSSVKSDVNEVMKMDGVPKSGKLLLKDCSEALEKMLNEDEPDEKPEEDKPKAVEPTPLEYSDHAAEILMGNQKQLEAMRDKIDALLEVAELDEKAQEYRAFVGAAT